MEIKCHYCGKIFDYKEGIAHFKRTKHHYCSTRCQASGKEKHGLAKWRNKDKRYNIWCDVKRRAKRKGKEFTLSIYDIPKIPSICSVLGIQIKANIVAGPLDSSPSLDRIDNKIGYIPGNVRIISNRANRLRQDATISELKLIIKDNENLQSKNK